MPRQNSIYVGYLYYITFYSADAVIQSGVHIVHLESPAEDPGSKVQSSNSISVIRVKGQSVFTSHCVVDGVAMITLLTRVAVTVSQAEGSPCGTANCISVESIPFDQQLTRKVRYEKGQCTYLSNFTRTYS